MKNGAPGYRPEVDGLRAIAVVYVVAFHAGLPGFSGGYLGVDIFFVISGYLITTILIGELENGRFSILEFYKRRAKRILPALILVLTVSAIFAWLWLTPRELQRFGQSLVAVSVFLSNIYFMRGGDYFDPSAEHQVLLHTWSLAVEEQFYALFPLLLLLLWPRGTSKLGAGLLALFIASLLGAEWASQHAPRANFYLLPGRAWELLAGALVALPLSRCWFASWPIAARELGGALGLVAILIPLHLHTAETPVPSLHTLLPVAGVALVIGVANSQIFIGRLLSTRPLVAIGLVSYSFYLWHQPVFVFAQVPLLGRSNTLVQLGLILLAFLLAVASWHWVEQPLRRVAWSTRKVLIVSGAASLVLVTVGLGLHGKKGFPDRVPSTVLSSLGGLRPSLEDCPVVERSNVRFRECLYGDESGPMQFAVIGDSHALALAPVFRQLAHKLNARIQILSLHGCPPIPGIEISLAGEDHYCRKFNDVAFTAVTANPEILGVVLAARWVAYLEGWFNNGVGGHEAGGAVMRITGVHRDEIAEHQIDQLSKRLSSKQVIMLKQGPEFAWDVPRYAWHSYLMTGDLAGPRLDRAILNQRMQSANELVDKVAASTGARVVDLMEVFCTSEWCTSGRAPELLFWDDDHVSSHGAALIFTESELASEMTDLVNEFSGP